MTTADLLQFHIDMCEKGRAIMEKKNHDYSGDPNNPFKNFSAAETLGVTNTENAFLVRMLDKMQRLATFAREGKLLVLDENVEDTCLDLVNYSILLAAYVKHKSTKT